MYLKPPNHLHQTNAIFHRAPFDSSHKQSVKRLCLTHGKIIVVFLFACFPFLCPLRSKQAVFPTPKPRGQPPQLDELSFGNCEVRWFIFFCAIDGIHHHHRHRLSPSSDNTYSGENKKRLFPPSVLELVFRRDPRSRRCCSGEFFVKFAVSPVLAREVNVSRKSFLWTQKKSEQIDFRDLCRLCVTKGWWLLEIRVFCWEECGSNLGYCPPEVQFSGGKVVLWHLVVHFFRDLVVLAAIIIGSRKRRRSTS